MKRFLILPVALTLLSFGALSSCSDAEKRELPATMRICDSLKPETPVLQQHKATLCRRLEAWKNGSGELEDSVALMVFLAAQTKAEEELLLPALRELQDAGADIRAVDEKGTSALLYAAFGGFRGVVDYLLEEKMPLTDTNSVGCTLLMMAAQGGQVEMIRYLQELGQSISATDKLGNNALIYAS